MRCREARHRLIDSAKAGVDHAQDADLQEHLRNCPACARQAEAARELRTSLAASGAPDNHETIPFAALKTRVETTVDARRNRHSLENRIMQKVANTLKRRSGLSISLGAVAVILLFLTLVPLKFDDTVGYEVAFAGVNKDLALDEARIDKLLDALGVADATAVVGDCETTCNVVVADLKTDEDVNLVITAFDQLGAHLIDGVSEVKEDGSTCLIEIVSMSADGNIAFGDDDAQNICLTVVTEALEGLGDEFSIYMCDSGNVEWTTLDCEDGAIWSVYSNDSAGACCPGGTTATTAVTTWMTDGGEATEVDLNDPELMALLESKGITLGTGDSAGISIITMDLKCSSEDGEGLVEVPEDALAKEGTAGELPSEYSLSQNYPNPFNPSTTIQYYLPKAERVTLEVVNINGQLVTTLVEGTQSAGEHSVEWRGVDASGSRVASGVYLYRLTAGETVIAKKMNLVK